jgi:hypothetical protein
MMPGINEDRPAQFIQQRGGGLTGARVNFGGSVQNLARLRLIPFSFNYVISSPAAAQKEAGMNIETVL